MKYNVKSFSKFDTAFKRLSKKYKSLARELVVFSENLSSNPRQGKDLGAGFYKIRLSSESKGGGKSGGFRVITYYIEQKGDTQTIFLVTIYDKSEESSVDKKELLKILENELY